MVLTLGGGGDGEVKQGIAAAKDAEGPAQLGGWGSGYTDGNGLGDGKAMVEEKQETKKKIKLVNRAGESRSPYVSLDQISLTSDRSRQGGSLSFSTLKYTSPMSKTRRLPFTGARTHEQSCCVAIMG
jgi:hypothetical protein